MATSTRYDRTTGQVFRQWDVPMPETMQQLWHCVPRLNIWRDTNGEPPRERGPASLVDICIRVVTQHCDDMDEVHLRGLPISLVGRIWEYVKREENISVQMWKLLALRITEDEEAAKRCIYPDIRRHAVLVHKTQPLGAYIKPLLSDALLTHLTITGAIRCDAPEILQLVQLKNLAILEFLDLEEEGAPWRLTDQILREWSISPDPFPHLKILRVWGINQTTKRSLRYLNAFPSLVIYDVAGDYGDWRVSTARFGWEVIQNTWEKEFLYKTLLKQTEVLSEFGRVADFSKAVSDIPSKQIHGVWSRTSSYSSPILTQSQRYYSGNPWGFLLYCYLGGEALDEGDDFDLFFPKYVHAWGSNYGFRSRAIPPRPMLNLILGDGPYNPGEYLNYRPSGGYKASLKDVVPKFLSAQATFFRLLDNETTNAPEPELQPERAAAKRPSGDPLASRKLRKKKHVVSSILESFETGRT